MNEPPPTRLRRCLLVLVPCAVSGVVLRLSYPVPGWFPLAWVALVPWLVTVRNGSRRAAVWGSAVMGLTGAGLGLSWQYIVTVLGGAMLTVYVGFYFVLFACLVRTAHRRLRVPFVLAAPAVWVGCEYLRSFALTGFPWLLLGHTQQPFHALVQVSDLFGAYAVSFIVMAANALAADAAGAWRSRQRLVVRLAGGGLLVAALVVGALGYGRWRVARLRNPVGPRVGIVQGNIPQEVKNDLSIETICDLFAKHLATTFRLEAEAGDEALDLVVWPESMVQWALNHEDPQDYRDENAPVMREAAAENGVPLPAGVAPDFRSLLWWLAGRMRAPVLVGGHARIGCDDTFDAPAAGTIQSASDSEIVLGDLVYPLPDFHDAISGKTAVRRVLVRAGQQVSRGEPLVRYESIVYNSGYLFRPDGPREPVERYDKLHLVPFGEYVPLDGLLWFVRQAVPYAKGFTSGERATLFEVAGHRFGVLICFEDVFPRVVRRFVVRPDGGADFLVNISNDGWFKGSHELDQHLAMTTFRAIEFRTGIVRCTNTGISCVIAPDGRIQTMVRGSDGRAKEVRGVAIARVRLRTGLTFYARHGDMLARVCLALAALAFLVGAVVPVVGWLWARMPRRRAEG